MILSDRDIKNELKYDLVIDPFDPERLQPASYDCALDNKFRIMSGNEHLRHIDPTKFPPDYELYENYEFYLRPRDFVLAVTKEFFKIPPILAARIEGKSSLGRCGLLVHSTAGFIDPGFEGKITLELHNISNVIIKLSSKMKIAQIAFMRLTSECERPYGSPELNSKYQGDMEPMGSLAYLDYGDIDTYP